MKLSTQAFSHVSVYFLTRAGLKKGLFITETICIKLASYIVQGTKNVSSGSPGQVDFLANQVTLKPDLPKGLDKSSLTKLLTKTSKLEGAPGKQNARAACQRTSFNSRFFRALIVADQIKLA